VGFVLGVPLNLGIIAIDNMERPAIERPVTERTLDELTKIRIIMEQE
jgi:hypothetical protein